MDIERTKSTHLESYGERKAAASGNRLSVKHKNSSRHSSIEGSFRNYVISGVYELYQYSKNIKLFSHSSGPSIGKNNKGYAKEKIICL
jgi:hypothetical protein